MRAEWEVPFARRGPTSESGPSMRAVRDRPIPPAERSVRRGKHASENTEACWTPVLVERARSEGARSTRAVGVQTGRPLERSRSKLESIKWKRKGSLDGTFRSQSAHDQNVLARCAQ